MPPTKLLNDAELTPQHIAELENSDQVIRFFAMLGYDVDEATELDRKVLNMDTEDLLQRVGHVFKIGTGRDEDIEIYLFEVRSVTVDLTQKIVRKFPKSVGSYLFLLTSEYKEIDFVLVDKIKVEGAEGAVQKYAYRPRILTVQRRNPGIVALRVIRRFTFTETYDTDQWEKLRSAYNLAEWSEPEFNNRALFSDYYLKHRLTDKTNDTLNRVWADEVHREGDEAKRLIAGARSKLTGKPEAKTRAELIEPLLKLLGFEFTVRRSDGSIPDEPDYALYAPGKLDKPVALPDYSPVVISYAKAAETAINERLFLPFRAAGYTARDCHNEFFQKFMAGGKPLTLGSMGILLGSSDETAFRAFVSKQYPDAARTIFAQDKLLSLLTRAQVDARNGAAHDGVMTVDDANTARQWAIEILGYV